MSKSHSYWNGKINVSMFAIAISILVGFVYSFLRFNYHVNNLHRHLTVVEVLVLCKFLM